MKKSIYARTVAKAISFPGQIEVHVQPLDTGGNGIGYDYTEGPYAWDEVKAHYGLSGESARQCESFFEAGEAALIAEPQEMDGDWPEPIQTTGPPEE